MGKFESKKVLVIGSGIKTTQNVEYYKQNGAYVILANKRARLNKAFRSRVDETAVFDIDNTNKVIAYCKSNKIDGVVTNGSEPSYEVARIINEGIGNKFCHTAKQWQTFMNKGNFKKLCLQYGIDTPKTYYFGKFNEITTDTINNIVYPVIVKPVDNCGADGISVIYSNKELYKAIKLAKKYSKSKNIIIEEFIVGKECAFTYVIQDGVYKLIASADKYVYKDENGLSVMPDLYIYPCKLHDLYMETVDNKVIDMLKHEELNNCTIFFQAIEKDGKYYFFEAGMRFEGTRVYHKKNLIIGQDFSHLYYDYILKTKTDYNIELDDPKFNGNAIAVFIVHLKRGKIKSITGANTIRENKKILCSSYVKGKGAIVGKLPLDGGFVGYCMYANDMHEVVDNIKFIKQNIKVKDIFNRDMIIDSFDETILLI